MRRATPYVVAALILVPVVALVLGDSESSGMRPAPPLPERVLAGRPVTIEGLRGKPAIVHFWASWCKPCEKEGPELRRLSERLGSNVALVGVDWSDRRDRALAFVRRHGWRFPILEDARSQSGQRYGVAGLPTTFIVDAHGRIVRQLAGPQTEDGLIDALESATSPLPG